MKTTFNGIITLFLAFIVQLSFAQERTISGTVSDESGPLPGVSVIKKGTTIGTETDFDGNYKIKAKTGDVLVFSFVGMKTTEKTVGTGNSISMTMESDNLLEEVVVVAYGTQKKSSISGSIQTIKSEELAKAQTANVIQSLSGKATGIQIKSTSGQPGKEPEVRFRGIGSLSSSNKPLYVVNGIPYNGNISSISSQDIESVTFLKDASANALYGSRGANGVIVITTKRGKKGNIQITYQSKVGINSRATKDYEKITDPSEYYELETQRIKLGQMFKNGLSEQDALKYASSNVVSSLGGYNPYNVTSKELIDPNTGKINPNAKLLYFDDWDNALFSNSIRQEQFLNVMYGDDKINTYLSLGYLDDGGYVVNSGYRRITTRADINYKIVENIKFGLNLNYANSQMKDPQAGKNSGTFSNLFSWTRNAAPIFPIYARDRYGNIKYDKKGNKIYDFGKGQNENFDGNPTIRKYIKNMNPYATTLKNTQTNTDNNVNSIAYVSIDFLENFNFKYNLSYDFSTSNRLRYGWEVGGDSAPYNGSITNAARFESTFTNQQLLSWKKTFGNHNVDLMVGHESSDYKSEMFAGNKTNVVISDNVYLSNASKVGYLSGYNDLYQVEGYLSKFSYDYGNKYFVNGSFRRDASSVFHPDNRWGNFYGFGIAWNVSQEDFLSENKILTNLKLKASYGEQGNDNIFYPSYVNMDHRNFWRFSRNYKPYITQYDIAKDAKGNATITQSYLGNKELKWEVSQNLNIGTEIRLFDRLNIEANYFIRNVSDMLYNFPQQPSSGNPAITKNVADMQNKGFEVSIDADIVKSENTGLNFWINATHYKNKITKLPKPFTDGIFRFAEGYSAYSYYLREFVGVNKETGSGVWNQGETDKNGVSSGNKTTVTSHSKGTKYLLSEKTANPDIYGGFGFSFNYKKWSLSSSFAYQLGGYVYDGVYASMFVEGSGFGNSGHNFHKDVYKTWNTNNINAPLPRMTSTDSNQFGDSDLFLTKANYLSLENISLSYELSNDNLVKNIGIKSMEFNVIGSNLWLLSERQGFDPRTSKLGAQKNNGRTQNIYSPLKSISFGINVKF